MTSQIVFMEHNPLTTQTMESSTSGFRDVIQNFLYYPRARTSSQGSFQIDNLHRTFSLDLAGMAFFKGRYFRRPDEVKEYLQRRGIASDLTKLDYDSMATPHVPRNQVASYHLALLEEFRYVKDSEGIVPPSVRNRVQILLKSATSKYPLFLWKDKQFIHERTKEPIPDDTWIPLYRTGTILESAEEPFDLSQVKHVIN